MILALALRWRYVQEVSLSVDEFNTIWAAMNVPVRGLPSFPSGNIYPHGFIFTYLVVPFVLGKFNETLVHIPGLIVSLAMLPAAYWVGRKLFDERVALLATAALAVDPDAILWGGRVRMYGLLQLLTLLALYFYFRGLAGGRARDRYLAMVLVVAAIFTHAEAGLLIPALGVATLVAWPWRRLVRRDTILPFVVAGAGALVFYLISKYGQPGHLAVFEQENRFYLGLPSDPLSGPRIFAPVFLSLHRLPFTLLALAGLVFLFRPRWDRTSPLTFLYVVLLSLLVPLVLLANTTWQNERYLFLLIPLLYLAAAQALWRLVDLVPAMSRVRPWQPALGAFLVPLFIGLTGTHLAYGQELGYDRAFRTLRDELAPAAGDQVLTVSPSPCAVYLGHCDRFAIQHGYEEFVLSRPEDTVPVDLWTATPVLTQTAELVDLLHTAPRVWLVSDTWRFQTRYDGSFIQTVLDHMDLVYQEQGVLIFRADGYQVRPPPTISRERRADFGQALSLAGFGLSTANPAPGDELEVTLNWQALEKASVGYTMYLHLLAPGSTGVAGVDEPVLAGLYQPDFWPQGLTFADRHTLALPADLQPGRYRLDLGLYPTGQPDALLPVAGSDHLPLAMLTVGQSPDAGPPTVPTDVTFGDQVRLLGFDLRRGTRPEGYSLMLYWQAQSPMARDYTVFVHVVDAAGNILAQDDTPPGGGAFFGTSTWLPGAVVLDHHTLAVPSDALQSEHSIVVGVYYRPTAERLPAVDGEGTSIGDAVPLWTAVPGMGLP
jgi:hypothetical protein